MVSSESAPSLPIPTRPPKRRIRPRPVPLSNRRNPKGNQPVFRLLLLRNWSVPTPIITTPRVLVGLSQRLGGGGNQSGSSRDSTFSHLRRWLFLIIATSSEITIVSSVVTRMAVSSTAANLAHAITMGQREVLRNVCNDKSIDGCIESESFHKASVLTARSRSTGGSVGLTAPRMSGRFVTRQRNTTSSAISRLALQWVLGPA